MVTSHELSQLGNPPNVSQLGDSDGLTSADVRERQAIAYTQVEAIVEVIEHILKEIAPCGFGPADRQVGLSWLVALKDAAAMHIKLEVMDILQNL